MPQRLNLVRRPQVPQQHRRLGIVCLRIQHSLVVVLIGIAVATAVGTGVVIAKPSAFHAETAGSIASVGRFLEVQAE